MDKDDVLREIRDLAGRGSVTRREILEAFHDGAGRTALQTFLRRINVATVLTWLGAAIVLVGIAVLVGQHWEDLGGTARILVTLGPGLACGAVGQVFLREKNRPILGHLCTLAAAVLIPLGLFVVFDVGGRDIESPGTHAWVFAITLAGVSLSWLATRSEVFLWLGLLFAMCVYFSLTAGVVESRRSVDFVRFTNYRILAGGAAVILLGIAALRSGRRGASEILHGVGALGLLVGALGLGGDIEDKVLLWVLLFPVLDFAVIFSSLILKSRSFLALGSLFLMVYIIKTTLQYFRHDLGWPVALVLSGIALIAIGYVTLRLDRRYLAGRSRREPG